MPSRLQMLDLPTRPAEGADGEVLRGHKLKGIQSLAEEPARADVSEGVMHR